MIAEKSSDVKVKRLEWFLLTMLRVESRQDAERIERAVTINAVIA